MPEFNVPPMFWVMGLVLGTGIVAYAVVQYFRVVHPSILETHKQQMAAQAATATDNMRVIADLLRDETAHCRAERKRDQDLMAAERDRDREFRHEQANAMQRAIEEFHAMLAEIRGLVASLGGEE